MENWYWLIIIGVLVVFYVLMIARQKRQEKKSMEALNSFRVGDKVVTHIGIYGRIKRIYNTTYGKVCVLEVGNLNKADIELDMRYIAGIDEKTVTPDEPKVEEKQKEVKAEETKTESEQKTEPAENTSVAEEQPKKSKKSK